MLSVVAFLAATAMTVVAAAASDAPEPAGPAAASSVRPSPTTRVPATRATDQAHCLIGSWTVVSEATVFAFYTNSSPQAFTMSGTRTYVFRPDGTLTNGNAYTLTATHRGNQIRSEATGTRELTWSLSGNKITYGAVTSTDMVTKYFDQRGLIETTPEQPNPNLNEVDDITCSGNEVVESNAKGYRSVWARTADYGVYG